MTPLPPMPGTRPRAGLPGGPGGRPAPEPVEGARRVWLATCVLQIIGAAAIGVGFWLEPGELLRQMSEGAAAGGVADLPPDQRLAVARVAAAMFPGGMIVLAGLFAWLANRMRDGSAGARLVLVAGSAYLAVGALFAAFGQGATAMPAAAPQWLQVLGDVSAILSGVTAATGMVLASGSEASEWFAGRTGRGNGKETDR